ncbi:hypothetical protein E4U42_004923 [Claviceps africana]|uniref:Uncharacterized protein n=1 Tax=Claviceps africana TaxID=83212 RepID=A0A8K0J5H5_9HYPO|nr:hypothetical protein E4U42_004923 [Claviceps africana]
MARAGDETSGSALLLDNLKRIKREDSSRGVQSARDAADSLSSRGLRPSRPSCRHHDVFSEPTRRKIVSQDDKTRLPMDATLAPPPAVSTTGHFGSRNAR